jgi:DNA-binding Lrp family transcriptional regulator
MLMIVRLYPKTDLSRVWNYIENEIKDDSSKSYTPLYASQSEGMMNVGVIIDVKKPNDIANFLTDDIVKCDEIHYTKTVPLLKPVFFRIPKRKPEMIQRYLIRIFAHPLYYKKVYNHLINYKYPFNIFPIYVSYSLGGEDIIMSLAADSKESVKKFLREQIRTLDGVDQSNYYPVFRAKRFASLKKLIKEQEKLLAKGIKKPIDGVDFEFDWVEDFEKYAMLTGAFSRDI